MAKAIKLPSGRWRCQVFDYKDEQGKIHRQSFTADTKREAERLAAMWQSDREEQTDKRKMTLQKAMDSYIANNSNVLSPATIKTYKGYARNHFAELRELDINALKRSDIQTYINDISSRLQPKTVANVHGFIAAVLHEYRPDFVLNTKLPQRNKNEMNIPTKEDLQIMLDDAEKIEDKSLYFAILLASHMGLRRGEVCALEWQDIDFEKKVIRIDKALTVNDQKEFVEKAPKSYSGFRTVPIPATVLQKLEQYKQDSGKVVDITPSMLTNRFKRFRRRLGKDYTYHNLRHYYASVMLSLGVPDKYAMEIMGHATNNMLKTVYQHTMDEKMKEVTEKLDSYFV